MKTNSKTNLEVPKQLLNLIGKEVDGFILTGVIPKTKSGNTWVAFGLPLDTKISVENIESWKKASISCAKGGFGFIPGKKIGNFN